jgi:hypothetical protein
MAVEQCVTELGIEADVKLADYLRLGRCSLLFFPLSRSHPRDSDPIFVLKRKEK